MAKKEKAQSDTEVDQEVDSLKLSKLLINELNKDSDKTGKVAWCLATDDDNPTDVKEFISFGSTLLDYIATNRENGGAPVGKLTEITGEEASGKSLILAHLMAETQRRGGIAAYLDVENSANPEFMTRLGVNTKELIYLQPQTVEEVGEAIEKIILMVRTRAPNKLVLIAWDSIAATPAACEIEGDFALGMDLQLAKSKILAKMMRKITQTLGKERICLVFTNQLKTKIGVMYGDPLVAPGGKAVPFHASLRIRLEAGQKQKDAKTEEIYGIHTRAKIVKNRLGPPWRKAEFDILFASGIDNESSWLQKLHEVGEIEKADGWCYMVSYPSGKLGVKGVWAGKDRGIGFREKEFSKLVKEDEKLRLHVLSLLKNHMIVKYGEKPRDLVEDPGSLIDDATVEEIVEKV